ncbi:hypothetical protein [Marinisporobacter balticus]|nr:hypothetical protein [Marinisporobacter balticus]
MGRPKSVCGFWQVRMQSEGRFYMVGKSFIAVEASLIVIGFQLII